MSTNPFYLHFVTDLRRAVFCMNSQNLDGAKTFLNHANKIYEEQLKYDGVRNTIADNFDSIWLTIYQNTIPHDLTHQQKFAEQILTLSSIIFLRSQPTSAKTTVTVVQSEEVS